MYTVIARNTTDQPLIFEDLHNFNLMASGTINLLEYFSSMELARSDDLILHISSGNLVINSGDRDLDSSESLRYVSLYKHLNPITHDGREIIRADTRPLDTQTYFTSCGDDMVSYRLGEGKELVWDFSNDDDLYDPNDFENPVPVASGLKAKIIHLQFFEDTYLKDGTLFFFDAPWGAYASMYIVIPSGSYYPNPYGSIPASALGLSGNLMYAYATKNVFFACYVNKQHMYSSCPMGDELNAEGCQIDPTPTGWYISAIIANPENDSTMKGYGSFEMYRGTIYLLEP